MNLRDIVTRGRSHRAPSQDPSLAERVEALGQAATLATGRLDSEAVTFAEAIVTKADERLRHGTSHLLVAFLGATGSGKSSLCNTITGSRVATTSVRRPTTSSTLACVWGATDANSLLDWLGVSSRHLVLDDGSDTFAALDGLVLLDVPDHDSVEVSHHLEMEQIAEHADLLVWITDPEKYADAVLHRYLQRLSHHGAAMVLVLNKSDQLSPAELLSCQGDLVRLVTNDGVTGTPVLTTSATTTGESEDLRDLLVNRVQNQTAIMTRLEADTAVAASDLLAAATYQAGQEPGSPLSSTAGSNQPANPAGVTKQITETLSHDLTAAAGIETVQAAIVSGYQHDARAHTGWPFTRWTRRLRPHPLRRLHLEQGSAGRSTRPPASAAQRTRALASVRNAADSASTGLDEPWPQLIRQAGVPPENTLFDRLDLAVSNAVRAVQPRKPLWWKLIGLVQILLAIATVVGILWLVGLAGAAWLQLPAPPTPSVGRVPIPTGLFLGGALLGWLLSVGSRFLSKRGAQRAGKVVGSDIASSVREVATELILAPIEEELATRTRLLSLLRKAGAP